MYLFYLPKDFQWSCSGSLMYAMARMCGSHLKTDFHISRASNYLPHCLLIGQPSCLIMLVAQKGDRRNENLEHSTGNWSHVWQCIMAVVGFIAHLYLWISTVGNIKALSVSTHVHVWMCVFALQIMESVGGTTKIKKVFLWSTKEDLWDHTAFIGWHGWSLFLSWAVVTLHTKGNCWCVNDPWITNQKRITKLMVCTSSHCSNKNQHSTDQPSTKWRELVFCNFVGPSREKITQQYVL